MRDDQIIEIFHQNGITVIKEELMVKVGRALVNAKAKEISDTADRLVNLMAYNEIHVLLDQLEKGIQDERNASKLPD